MYTIHLALLLRNVWALLHLTVLARRRRGGPRLRPWLLTLPDLLNWIRIVLEEELGVREDLEVDHPFVL